MNTKFLNLKLALSIAMLLFLTSLNAQSVFIPADSIAPSNLTYTYSGGSFQSYGCSGLDPTYWLSGSGDTIKVNFVLPQTNPSFRVWGMNDDDSAEVFVNTNIYPLSTSSASYDTKVICNILGSPGPNGVVFSSGLLVGSNSNSTGNYSYQNVTLNTPSVASITIVGKSGNGWGFAGVTITQQTTNINSFLNKETTIDLIPNPASNELKVSLEKNVTEFKIKIFNLLGELMFYQEYNGNNSATIDITSFQKGSYLIEIKTKDRSHTKRIVKQ